METPIGWVPEYEDLQWTGLDKFSREKFEAITAIHHEDWAAELFAHDELFSALKSNLPRELVLRRELLQLNLTR